jgi:hypothetical protein
MNVISSNPNFRSCFYSIILQAWAYQRISGQTDFILPQSVYSDFQVSSSRLDYCVFPSVLATRLVKTRISSLFLPYILLFAAAVRDFGQT